MKNNIILISLLLNGLILSCTDKGKKYIQKAETKIYSNLLLTPCDTSKSFEYSEYCRRSLANPKILKNVIGYILPKKYLDFSTPDFVTIEDYSLYEIDKKRYPYWSLLPFMISNMPDPLRKSLNRRKVKFDLFLYDYPEKLPNGTEGLPANLLNIEIIN